MITKTTLIFIFNMWFVWFVGLFKLIAEEPFSVVGYLPEYRLTHVKPKQLNTISDLIYFGIEPTENGSLPEDSIDPSSLEKIRELQKNLECRMLISVGGWGRSKHFPALSADPTARRRFVASLKSFCLIHRFHGIDFDWEHPKNEDEIKSFTKLLAETRSSFDPHGLVVTMAQASWQDLGTEVYKQVDRVHLMSYDHRFPQATLQKSIADVERLIASGCPREKIVLGVPFYGRNKERHALTYRELIANADFDPYSDEINGYAFNGQETISKKLDYAIREKLAGIMIWEIGQDSMEPGNSLLRVIQDRVSVSTD